MAANIEFNKEKRTHSFYSLKENAWHGLSQIFDDIKTPEEIIKLANLDYEVALAPLYANFIPKEALGVTKCTDGTFQCELPNKFISLLKSNEEIQTHYATYRTDNYNIFGVVGSRYEPVQNTVAIDFIYQILQNQNLINPNDIIIETAGVLGIGERIFVTAKLPSFDIAGDETQKYILFTTTHDGSGSIAACFTNIRVVCNNTLNAALSSKDTTNKIYFKHTKNVKNRLNEAAKLMHDQIYYSNSQKQILELASNIQINKFDYLNYIEDLFLTENQKQYSKDQGGFLYISNGDEIITSRTLNKMVEVSNFIENGIGQDNHQGTALWLYNGVTSWLNNGIIYKNKEDKFNSITEGNSSKINQKAFNILNNLIAA